MIVDEYNQTVTFFDNKIVTYKIKERNKALNKSFR